HQVLGPVDLSGAHQLGVALVLPDADPVAPQQVARALDRGEKLGRRPEDVADHPHVRLCHGLVHQEEALREVRAVRGPRGAHGAHHRPHVHLLPQVLPQDQLPAPPVLVPPHLQNCASSGMLVLPSLTSNILHTSLNAG
ncbi:pot1 protection of telomeres 1-like protein, partial [Nannochloropsis gaditana CCMP526]|uniref:pot1 protection of telomeres 1-like protein n=1 Tax=Nannochloropsis gaditana (strain CCMP526) TaxID=1093141 RepID=UPI00029F8026